MRQVILCLFPEGSAHESPEVLGHASDHLDRRFFFYRIERIRVHGQESNYGARPIPELELILKRGSI
jgi:hypothetical protein